MRPYAALMLLAGCAATAPEEIDDPAVVATRARECFASGRTEEGDRLADRLAFLIGESHWSRDSYRNSRRILATYYESREDWLNAVIEWGAWRPRHECGNARYELEAERQFRLVVCVEHLGYRHEAAAYYRSLVGQSWRWGPEAEKRLDLLKPFLRD